MFILPTAKLVHPLRTGENQLATHVDLLSRTQIDRLPERAREIVEYRKTSLNLITRSSRLGTVPGA